MYVYLLMFVISLTFALLFNKSKTKKYRIICAFLSTLPFAIVSSIRYDVGTDYFYRYVPDFNIIALGGKVSNYEIGFSILNKIISNFGGNYEWLFIITTSIIIFPTFYVIFKKSKNPALSVLLFFAGGFFFMSMNLIRQFISVVFCFVSYDFLLDRKYFKWIIFLLAGFLFHTSIVIFLIAFVFCKKLLINFKCLGCITVLTVLFNSILRSIIISILSMTRFSVYINTNYGSVDIKPFLIITNLVIYIFMYYIYFHEDKDNIEKKDVFYLNLQGMAIVLSLLGSIFSILSRLIAYFSIFQIISIPHLLSKCNDKNKRKLTIIIIIIFLIHIGYTNFVNNDNGVVPYHTIFER